MIYYNENDKFCVEWLRELSKAKLIADGEVDDRSIKDVRPEDLVGFTQCHFFAGIGGWSYALRLAGWPDTRSVWTGSCPCQPYTAARHGARTDDPRHLWPAFFKLIEVSRPSVIFGEQVASADGRAWLDLLYTDLESAGYGVGAANLCAAGVGAPHIRQRLYWVADAVCERRNGYQSEGDTIPIATQEKFPIDSDAAFASWRTLAGDYHDLLPCNGLPLALERRAIRGYGNAIVPQVAAEFIKAYGV